MPVREGVALLRLEDYRRRLRRDVGEKQSPRFSSQHALHYVIRAAQALKRNESLSEATIRNCATYQTKYKKKQEEKRESYIYHCQSTVMKQKYTQISGLLGLSTSKLSNTCRYVHFGCHIDVVLKRNSNKFENYYSILFSKPTHTN